MKDNKICDITKSTDQIMLKGHKADIIFFIRTMLFLSDTISIGSFFGLETSFFAM